MANGCGHNMHGGPGSAVVCRFLEISCTCTKQPRIVPRLTDLVNYVSEKLGIGPGNRTRLARVVPCNTY